MESTPTPPYTVQEAADLLEVGRDWLERQVTEHRVEHLHIAGAIRFTEEHLATIAAMPGMPVIRARHLAWCDTRRARYRTWCEDRPES